VALDEGLAVACMALLVLLTLGNVVTRYVVDESFAWTEEISVFLMVVMTLAGASAAAARERHIRVEFLQVRGAPSRRRALRVFAGCITGLVFAVLAGLFARVVADEMRFGETSMGLDVPRWWFTVFSPLLCAAVALRSFALAWRIAKAAEATEAVVEAGPDAEDPRSGNTTGCDSAERSPPVPPRR